MQNDTSELDQMQSAYKVAVEEWIAAIRQEEALASVNHSIAEVEQWEGAHFAEDATHLHHHSVIKEAAKSEVAIGEKNVKAEQRVLEEPTIWWFAALLFLLGFSALDIIIKSMGRPRQQRK